MSATQTNAVENEDGPSYLFNSTAENRSFFEALKAAGALVSTLTVKAPGNVIKWTRNNRSQYDFNDATKPYRVVFAFVSLLPGRG